MSTPSSMVGEQNSTGRKRVALQYFLELRRGLLQPLAVLVTEAEPRSRDSRRKRSTCAVCSRASSAKSSRPTTSERRRHVSVEVREEGVTGRDAVLRA